eukprot:1145963-Pelagomonas_calceolata.AAC.8
MHYYDMPNVPDTCTPQSSLINAVFERDPAGAQILASVKCKALMLFRSGFYEGAHQDREVWPGPSRPSHSLLYFPPIFGVVRINSLCCNAGRLGATVKLYKIPGADNCGECACGKRI